MKNRHKRVPPQLFPRNAQRAYTSKLNMLVNKMLDLTKTMLYPQLSSIINQAKLLRPITDSIHQDNFSDAISHSIEQIKSEFGNQFREENFQEMAITVGVTVSQFNRKETLKVVRSLGGIDVFMAEPYLDSEMSAFVRQNVALIKTIPNRYFNEIE